MEIKDLANKILNEAISQKASDIFFLPRGSDYDYSIRTVNGVELIQNYQLDKMKELINYLKYTAQMDISEHRRPQVGAINYEYDNCKYYLRLSSIGNFDEQESLVIRIIYGLNESKYFYPEQLVKLAELSQKRGLIITSGPTGSGKTTTMYEIAKVVGQQKMIMTIEDPVEVYEKQFLQTQVNQTAGISYLSLLKASLRHRPDILIIGEIRDGETARLAVDAALSGHLVFATVHAKTTLQTIARLKALGISENELKNCLTAVSYQRLMPSKSGMACLMDVASYDLLKKNIKKIEQDFNEWQDNLKKLKQEGEIDAETYKYYQEG